MRVDIGNRGRSYGIVCPAVFEQRTRSHRRYQPIRGHASEFKRNNKVRRQPATGQIVAGQRFTKQENSRHLPLAHKLNRPVGTSSQTIPQENRVVKCQVRVSPGNAQSGLFLKFMSRQRSGISPPGSNRLRDRLLHLVHFLPRS